MAVNKEKGKAKRKRMDSPWVVGMSVQFEHCSKCLNMPNKDKLFEHGSTSWKWVYNISEHCPNSAKHGQTVQTVFEQHTTARRAVRTQFKQLEVGV